MTTEAGDWDRWEDSHAKAQRREDMWTESFPKLCVLASLREIWIYGRRQTRRDATNPSRASLRASRAESAQKIDHQAYRQDQAKPAAADDGTAKVKPAAAEQEKQNHQE